MDAKGYTHEFREFTKLIPSSDQHQWWMASVILQLLFPLAICHFYGAVLCWRNLSSPLDGNGMGNYFSCPQWLWAPLIRKLFRGFCQTGSFTEWQVAVIRWGWTDNKHTTHNAFEPQDRSLLLLLLCTVHRTNPLKFSLIKREWRSVFQGELETHTKVHSIIRVSTLVQSMSELLSRRG